MTAVDTILDSFVEFGKSIVTVLLPVSLAMIVASMVVSWLCSVLEVQDHSLGVCARWVALLSMLWYFSSAGFYRIKEQTLFQWEQISIIGKSSNP